MIQKQWSRRFGALAIALALALSVPLPALAAESSAAPTREAVAAQAAQAAGQYGEAVSVQYALWEDGKITLSGHLGNYSRTENRALLDTDLYGIGSVSKMYTTATVMKLSEQGKLSLDAPVTRYLPSFRMADERYRNITVRMLLNHSSGLMGTSGRSAFLFSDTDRSAAKDLLQRLSTQRLKADPGAYSVYCNDGFTLAELVVEAVSGMEFPAYLRSAVLTPGGLGNTFAPGEDFDTSRLVKTYADAKDTRALPQDTLGIVGTGGLYASASDLASFGGILCGGGVLSQSSLDAMAAAEYKNGLWPADDEDQLSYGLGWDAVKFYPFAYSGIQALAKGGDTLRYHAGLVVIPKYRMAAAVLTSGGVSTYNEMAASQILIAALAAKGISVDQAGRPLSEAQKAAMPAALTDLSGYYGATTQQMKVDVTADGVLSLRSLTVPSAPVQTFSYYSDGSFRDASGTAMIKPVQEKNGQTYLWQKAAAALPVLGPLPISNYAAVKLAPSEPAADVRAAWTEASAKGYLPLSEKYTSQIWLALSQSAGAELPDTVPGYHGAARITDAAHALYALQIPGSAGRDGQDITLIKQNGFTYLDAQGSLYAEESIAQPIYGGPGAYCTIAPDGYARWYRVGAAAGMTLRVQSSGQGGFFIYDADGRLTASSSIWGDSSAVLPEGGYVAFAGDVGVRFHLSASR